MQLIAINRLTAIIKSESNVQQNTDTLIKYRNLKNVLRNEE